jgi:hypothetical protein
VEGYLLYTKFALAGLNLKTLMSFAFQSYWWCGGILRWAVALLGHTLEGYVREVMCPGEMYTERDVYRRAM